MRTRLRVVLFLGLFLQLISPTKICAQDQQVLDTLIAYDQAFLSGFTASMTASYPMTGFDPTQGSATSAVTITSDGIRQALVLHRNVMDKPRFSADRIDRDYDEGGNYVLSSAKDIFIHLGPDSWKTRIDNERASVASTGAVVETRLASPFFEVRPVGHQDAKNRLYRYLLPLGRGYSQLLDQVTGTTTMEDGTLNVIARGSLFSSQVGEWQIRIDTTKDHLVRSATFSADGTGNPSILLSDVDGGIEGIDLPLWESGTFSIGSEYPVFVSLNGYSSQPDNVLIGQVRDAVDTVQPNSTIMDFSNLDLEGRPLVLRGIEVP